MALENAKLEIFITDWWLAPEFYLKRPIPKNEDSRVDRVLIRAAQRGVKVRIIVYWESNRFLTINSKYT